MPLAPDPVETLCALDLGGRGIGRLVVAGAMAAAARSLARAERVVLGAFVDVRQIPDEEDGPACVLVVATGVSVPVEHVENLGDQAHAHTVVPHAPLLL